MKEEKPITQMTKTIYGPCALIFCSTSTGTWRIVRPLIDESNCVLCGTCEKHCPTGVMHTRKDNTSDPKRSAGTVEIDLAYCKGCGICANVCPKGSIRMVDERGA